MKRKDKPLKRMLDHLLENGRMGNIYPGAVLLLGLQTHIIYLQACGHSCLLPEAEDMRHDTLFDLASLTKVLVTVPALMLLLDEKRLDLDDPVGEYLTGFGSKQPGRKQATIRQLLTHSSGLESWLPFYEDIRRLNIPFGPLAKDYIIERIYHHHPVYPAGEKSIYSDLGFILLGRLIETVTGLSLEEFCSNRIFKPLKMDRAFWGGQMQLEARGLPVAATEFSDWRGGLLRGQVHDENAYVMGGSAGHAGLFSVAENIFRFCQAMLFSLKNDTGFWPKSLITEMVTKQNLPPGSSWALGWDTPSPVGSSSGCFFSPHSIGHTGFTGTSIWIDLPRELTVILLTNRIHPSRSNERIKEFRPLLHNSIREIIV